MQIKYIKMRKQNINICFIVIYEQLIYKLYVLLVIHKLK